MATTVNAAFAMFLRDIVNLDPGSCKTARASRDWLRGQLGTLHDKHDDFPMPYPSVNIDFGSFARKTKGRPLDDLDLIHGLHADSAYYADLGGRVEVTARPNTRLWSFRHSDSDTVNSRRVINKFVAHLPEVHQYASASVHRRGEAATLNLRSYDWSFDIVPASSLPPNSTGGATTSSLMGQATGRKPILVLTVCASPA